MAVSLGTLVTEFTADTKALDEGFAHAEKSAESTADFISSKLKDKAAASGAAWGRGISKGLTIAMGDIGAAIDVATGITAAGIEATVNALTPTMMLGSAASAAFKELNGVLVNATGRGLAYNDNLRKQQIQLELVTGSAAEAKKQLAQLGAITEATNVSKGFLTDSVQQLQLFGIESQKAIDLVHSFANVAAARGTGGEGVAGMTGLVSRMAEMGKVDARLVRGFVSQGVDVFGIIGDELHISKKRAQHDIEKGLFTTDEMIEMLKRGFSKEKFANAAREMVTGTLEGNTTAYERGVNRVLGTATKGIYKASVAGYGVANAAVRSPQAGQMAAGAEAALAPVTTGIEQTFLAMQSGDIFGGAVKSGAALISGITSGIEGKAGEASKALTDTSSMMLTNVKSWWGIQSPSDVMIKEVGIPLAMGITSGFVGYMDGDGKKLMLDKLEELLQDPRMKAFLEVIKKSEVGKDPNPYSRAFGRGGHIDPMTLKADGSDWYGERVFSPTLRRSVMTHAFGAYQAEPKTYRGFANRTGVSDVSPHSQDLFAVEDIMRNYPAALRMILEGNAKGAMSALKKEWESFAINPASKTNQLVGLFDSFITSGKALPVTIVNRESSNNAEAQGYFSRNMLTRAHAPVEDFNAGRDPFIKPEWAKPKKGLSDIRDAAGEIVGTWNEFNQSLDYTGQAVVNIEAPFEDLKTTIISFPPELLKLKPLIMDFGNMAEAAANTATEKATKLPSQFTLQMREMGFTMKNMGDMFESSLVSSFTHTDRSFKQMLGGFVVSFAQGVEQMVIKAEAAKLTAALFGEGGKGGLFGSFSNKLTGWIHPQKKLGGHSAVGGMPASNSTASTIHGLVTGQQQVITTSTQAILGGIREGSKDITGGIEIGDSMLGQSLFQMTNLLEQIAHPPQQGFWSGIVQALAMGAIAGAGSAATKGLGGGGGGGGGHTVDEGPASTATGPPTLKRRALGGDVYAGVPAVVGDRSDHKPEVFVPSRTGRVMTEAQAGVALRDAMATSSNNDGGRVVNNYISLPRLPAQSYSQRRSARQQAEAVANALQARLS
jgi:muramidase (phage lysozyme)